MLSAAASRVPDPGAQWDKHCSLLNARQPNQHTSSWLSRHVADDTYLVLAVMTISHLCKAVVPSCEYMGCSCEHFSVGKVEAQLQIVNWQGHTLQSDHTATCLNLTLGADMAPADPVPQAACNSSNTCVLRRLKSVTWSQHPF